MAIELLSKTRLGEERGPARLPSGPNSFGLAVTEELAD